MTTFSRPMYNVLRANGVGASEALRIARGFPEDFEVGGFLTTWMVANAKRPKQSLSIREVNAFLRADIAYCRANDC